MTNNPAYHSDEEILNRLRTRMEEAALPETSPVRTDRLVQEANALVVLLAERIYTDPERWGLTHIPATLRDDVAQDVLLQLLRHAGSFEGRETAVDWFTRRAERRFREMWRKLEALRAEGPPSHVEDAPSAAEEPDQGTVEVFDAADGPWRRFEHEFPRDAFALRLRYMLKRTPGEMMIMLDAPSTNAIESRLNRARGRIRMFCEQAGYDSQDIAAVLRHFESNGNEESV